MATCANSVLLMRWSRALAGAGIDTADLLSDGEEGAFGDGEASFRWRDLILRLVRDRGQEFVDLAPTHQPDDRFRLDDIGIALGWRRVEDVVSRTAPAPLADELAEIARRRDELEKALSVQGLPATRIAVEHAVGQRERAFLAKLRRLAENGRLLPED